MPPKNNTSNKKAPKKLLRPMPKIYGFFKSNNKQVTDEECYGDILEILKQDLQNIYPSYFKSMKILDSNKSGEITGLFNLYLTEPAKDLTQEQFNHIVRIVNKQSETLPLIKLFYVSTNEPNGVKYTFTNYVKNVTNTPIPNIFFFCDTNDITITNLKNQIKTVLKDKYMDFFAIKNKSKSEYNPNGGYFLKVRLYSEISEEDFKNTSETIREYFADNYQEDNIKTFYKTESETNGKRYTFTYPIANHKPTAFLDDN